MRALLQRAAQTGALALLTGRAVATADAILDGAISVIAGLHGLERRFGEGETHRSAQDDAPVRRVAEAFAAQIGEGRLQARLEDKGASVSLHYRHAPEAEHEVCAAAEAAAFAHGLRTLRGKMVIEILPFGATKGDALRDFMVVAPFAGRRPVMVGDDITDESAFEAANALGGLSILVGSPRETAARARVDGVRDVAAMLERALGARA